MGDPQLTPRPQGLDEWSRTNLRDLPWRHTRDPWLVLVSEVMSQQTQLTRVVQRWGAFIEQFPDVESCAAAPLADVLRAWMGLGYPRRARNLHQTATTIAADFDGQFPRSVDRLLSLPGVGEYTARAVGSFALELEVGVLDTNVGRILARVTGRPMRRRDAQALADAWVPPGESFRHNASMLDLGAMLCRPRDPLCGDCPLAPDCRWLADGGDDPAVGSAAVSRPQARFAGSDRQLRGRVLAVLAEASAPVCADELAQRAELGDRAGLILDGLRCDELASEIAPGLWTLGATDVTML